MMTALKLACLGLFCSLLGAPVFAQGYVVYRDLPYDTVPGVDARSAFIPPLMSTNAQALARAVIVSPHCCDN